MVLSGQQKGALSKNTHIFISYSLPLCALTLLFTNISRAVGPLRRLIYQPFTLYKILKFLSETSKLRKFDLTDGRTVRRDATQNKRCIADD